MVPIYHPAEPSIVIQCHVVNILLKAIVHKEPTKGGTKGGTL